MSLPQGTSAGTWTAGSAARVDAIRRIFVVVVAASWSWSNQMCFSMFMDCVFVPEIGVVRSIASGKRGQDGFQSASGRLGEPATWTARAFCHKSLGAQHS